MKQFDQDSYAKLNLFLAVTGPRPDGFHNLLSLFVRISLKDRLTLTLNHSSAQDTLTSNSQEIPPNKDNLILKATSLFRKLHPFKECVHFHLEKNIPIEAGLGGGSSNAVAALLALNKAFGNPLTQETLYNLAAQLGSDCPFFIEGRPTIIRGRGDLIEKVSSHAKDALSGISLLIFKPNFPIPTPWAYNQFRQNPHFYIPPPQAEALLENFQTALIREKHFPAHLTLNNFEKIVFKKFRALHQLSTELKEQFNAICRLCGSGSACYIFKPKVVDNQRIMKYIYKRLGTEAICTPVDIVV